MLSDYTFLTDHSYSLRPVADESSRTDPTEKKKSRAKKTPSVMTNVNRPASIDRSSSDKENNSTVLNVNSINTPLASSNTKRSAKKSSTSGRVTKKKPNTARRTRSKKSTDSSSGKKNSMKSKKKNPSNPPKNEFTDTTPALSIEERVKLRRTTPLTLTPSQSVSMGKKSSASTKKKLHSLQDDLKQIRQSMKKSVGKDRTSHASATVPSNNRTKKSFLGSGLDLDNIVLGNRQRRLVQS